MLKNLNFLLLFLTTLFASSSKDDIIFTKSKNVQIIDPIIMIYIEEEDLITGEGTGFSVSYDKKKDETYFLTNNHICTSEYSRGTSLLGRTVTNDEAVINYNAEGNVQLKIVSLSPENDLCLLKTSGYFRPVKINRKIKIRQGDKLTMIGAPNGNFPIILDTYFSGYLQRSQIGMPESDGAPIMMVSELLHPGHSGSPIYNKSGELVGIAFGSSVRGYVGMSILFSYGGFAVGLPDILTFLEQNDIK